MTAATVEAIDFDVVIAESEAAEKAADDRAILLRAQQKELVRRSLSQDVSTALGQVERAIDKAARDAERARARRQAALEERQSAGIRAEAASRARARAELVDLDQQRRRRLINIEALLQKFQGELLELRELEIQVLQRRSELGQGMGMDLRRLIADRASWLLGRAAGPAGLEMPPLTAKGHARRPLTEVFVPVDVESEA